MDRLGGEHFWSEATTLGDLLTRCAVQQVEGPEGHIVLDEVQLTYAQLRNESELIARALIARGTRPGDHIGIFMPNTPEMIASFFGTVLCGAVAVPINARYVGQELAYVVADSDIDVLLTTTREMPDLDRMARLSGALDIEASESSTPEASLEGEAGFPELWVLERSGEQQGIWKAERGASWFEAAEQVTADEFRQRRLSVRAGSRCLLIYTSGTTSRPRGCPHTHETLVRNARSTGRLVFRLGSEDVVWGPLPLFHVGGLIPLLMAVDAGVDFTSMMRFDPEAAAGFVERTGSSVLFAGFPTLLMPMMEAESFAAADLDRVRVVMAVGTSSFLRSVQTKFPNAVQISTYGMTETGGVFVYPPLEASAEERADYVGVPLPGLEIAVRDVSGHGGVRRVGSGEIGVRGYATADAYVGTLSGTTHICDEEGWYWTGDLGRLDDQGRLQYLGRVKEMMKVGGENVATVELEDVLGQFPGVRIAQVVGAPDDRYGEVPAAFLELLPDCEPPSFEDIQAFCRERMASFKTPRYVRFVEQWPTSATKIQRDVLRRQLLDELGG